MLIIAGAGAGKTKTLTGRIIKLILDGAAPESILAITFTNKAAEEMRRRINTALENPEVNRPVFSPAAPFISTFHALSAFILRGNAAKLSLPKNFVIFDRSDSRQAIKEALESSGLDPKSFEPGRLLSAISRLKSDGVNRAAFAPADGSFFEKTLAAIWRRYEEILRRENALDFDDLLLKTAELLRTDREARERCRRSWRHILVDEYQDTNAVQYEFLRLLAGEEKNICVVGDLDQTIYSWRGATIRNLLNFEKDYPGTKMVILEQNYRSTKNILAAAEEIISKNRLRVPKTLFTENGAGERIGLYAANDEADEASFVAGKAAALIRDGLKPEEIAVLYRANFQSRALEEAFLGEQIPYQVIGTRFFERREVKDVLAYLRLGWGGRAPADLKRVAAAPPKGIGKVTLLKIISGKTAALAGAGKRRVDELESFIKAAGREARKNGPAAAVKFIAEKSGMREWLEGFGEEGIERLENIKELAAFAGRYDHLPPEEGVQKFLTEAALASDQDELRGGKMGVKMMTVHTSKGLEFDCVFITGLEDGLFPHARAGEGGEEEAEEERRLFYVALTRARRKVFLSFAENRAIFGARQTTAPSEFLSDIPETLLEAETGAVGLKTNYLQI